MSPVIASHNHTGVRGAAAASQDRRCPSNGYVLYASYAIKSLESLLDFRFVTTTFRGAHTVDTKLSEYVKVLGGGGDSGRVAGHAAKLGRGGQDSDAQEPS